MPDTFPIIIFLRVCSVQKLLAQNNSQYIKFKFAKYNKSQVDVEVIMKYQRVCQNRNRLPVWVY